jgi:hypothetical protein
MSEQLPLPYGWVQEFDPDTSHPFWVCYTYLPSHIYSDHSHTISRWTLRQTHLVRSGHTRMKMSSTSGSTRRSEKKSAASLSSKAQRTPVTLSLLVAIPTTDMIAPAWFRTSPLRRLIRPRKGRKSEAFLASSKTRRLAPRKNGRHIRRSKLE